MALKVMRDDPERPATEKTAPAVKGEEARLAAATRLSPYAPAPSTETSDPSPTSSVPD
jgi:hypothetical protein